MVDNHLSFPPAAYTAAGEMRVWEEVRDLADATTIGTIEREGLTLYELTDNDDWRSGPPRVNKWAARISDDGHRKATPEELDAVARLFQHAPELLAAAKDILEEFCRAYSAGKPPRVNSRQMIGRLRAAISAAEKEAT